MSRVRAAANLAQARKRLPRYQGTTRSDLDYAADSVRMAHIVCGMFCHSCGVSVGADDLHSWDCPDVPKERRRCRIGDR